MILVAKVREKCCDIRFVSIEANTSPLCPHDDSVSSVARERSFSLMQELHDLLSLTEKYKEIALKAFVTASLACLLVVSTVGPALAAEITVDDACSTGGRDRGCEQG